MAAVHHTLHKPVLVVRFHALAQALNIRLCVAKPRAQRHNLVRIGRRTQQNHFELCLCHISSVRVSASLMSVSSRCVCPDR